jgi:hypothetical protein
VLILRGYSRDSGACGGYSGALSARAAVCACVRARAFVCACVRLCARVLALRLVPSDGCARVAAGVMWASRTTSAPWSAREGHTSVIDAAGAIYVIGSYDGGTYFNNVWASTDGGA